VSPSRAIGLLRQKYDVESETIYANQAVALQECIDFISRPADQAVTDNEVDWVLCGYVNQAVKCDSWRGMAGGQALYICNASAQV